MCGFKVELEDGFYWVRWRDEWMVAEKDSLSGLTASSCWFPTGCESSFHHDAFDEIDPRPIRRDNGGE